MDTGLLAFGTGAPSKLISQLKSRLKSKKTDYTGSLEEIKRTTYTDPLKIAKHYIEPDFQDSNPSYININDSMRKSSSSNILSPAMKTIDIFFRQKTAPTPGRNQMFVLSGAGTGKSSLLIMLKLIHLTALWPWQPECVLKKLNENTIKELKEIKNPQKIILLLDALNEDPLAYGRVKNRLMDILHASQYFYRVIITCRTQFFPDTGETMQGGLNLFSIGGFSCHIKYLSFFSDKKISAYLNMRFQKKFALLRRSSTNMQQAQNLIKKITCIRQLPVLMDYLEELIELPLSDYDNNEYKLYDALLQNRIQNEHGLTNRKISLNDLSGIYSIIAATLQIRKKCAISEAELKHLLDKISTAKAIEDIDAEQLSLLTITSDRYYHFSHYSIQEFFAAKLLLHGHQIYTPKKAMPISDFMLKIIGLSDQIPKYSSDHSSLNFRRMDLKGLNFSGMDFSGTDLENCMLEDTLFHGAKFIKAGLKNSRIDVNAVNAADFTDTDLKYTEFINKNLGMTFVYIPPGNFMMGDDETGPVHEVKLTKGFLMQTTLVTQKQWKQLMGNNPSVHKKSGSACPVENVSWKDVQSFINKLNTIENANYSLPTEAQWEYACRAGSTTKYHFGDQKSELKNYAWFKNNSNKRTHPVAMLRPNDWGLYDMHGNVWEWCIDWFDSYPAHSSDSPGLINPPVESEGHSKGIHKVVRGGSWYVKSEICYTAYRDGGAPNDRASLIGFRLIRLFR